MFTQEAVSYLLPRWRQRSKTHMLVTAVPLIVSPIFARSIARTGISYIPSRGKVERGGKVLHSGVPVLFDLVL